MSHDPYASQQRVEEHRSAAGDDPGARTYGGAGDQEPAGEESEVEQALAGNVEDATDWIGEDPDRAQAALEAEKADDGKQRKGVIEWAEAVLEEAESAQDED